MTTARPASLLIYYGYLNSFNSAINGWVNENVAVDMAKYDVLVFGNGIADPSHPDYANTQIIIARLKAIKPDIKIFGYASANQPIGDFQDKVDDWDNLFIDGIFMDEAGYDFNVTRDQLNIKITHVRSKTYAKICFVNSSNMDNIIGLVDDPSYPNSTYNPDLHQSLLDYRDYYLLENFSVSTASYSGNDGYAAKADVVARGQKAAALSAVYGIKLGVSGVINNENGSGQALSNFNYNSAVLIGADTAGTSDTNYAASSATVVFWNKPNLKHIGKTSSIAISESLVDSDIVFRFGDFSKVSLNFSTHISAITKW